MFAISLVSPTMTIILVSGFVTYTAPKIEKCINAMCVYVYIYIYLHRNPHYNRNSSIGTAIYSCLLGYGTDHQHCMFCSELCEKEGKLIYL